MEAEVFERLSRIENILILQSVIFSGLILGLIAMFVQSWLVRSAQIKSAIKQGFLDEAIILEDQGKYKDLLNLAHRRLQAYSNDITAKWYKAVSLYKLSRYGEALSEFSDIQSSDPAWQREIVEEYVAEIRANLNGPRSS